MLLCITVFCDAQNKNVTGKILDSKNKTPMPYVTITCKKNDGEIITGTITNDKGEFKVYKLPKEKINIHFQFIGYTSVLKKIDLSTKKSTYNLGTINLKESSNKLDEVEIKAKTTTIIQKIDRKIINIGNDLISSGNNSFDMLHNIPSIDVNQLSGTVSLRGNENVRILVNGKPSNINTEQLLKQIPSNSIKSIEIITNPSAKYNPEGMSGIINLILKKNTEFGFNGSVSIDIEHSKNTRPNLSLNTNYKVGITNFYANYNTGWGDYEMDNNTQRIQENLTQNLHFLNNSINHNFKLGVDLEVSDKSILSVYTSQNFDNNSLETKSLVNLNNNLLFNNYSLSVYKQKDESYNVDYVYKLNEKGQNIEFELNYSITNNPENTLNSEQVNNISKEYNYTNIIKDKRKLWLFNIDYIKPIKSGKIEFGIEFRKQDFFNQINSNQEVAINNPSNIKPFGSTTLNYNRNIYSGYFNFNKEFKKFAFQTGVRIEQFNLDALFSNTQQGTTPLKDNIFNIYPSASISCNITDKDRVQLAYSRRVDRPSSYQLTPIQEWNSPLTISKGNLHLSPQFTNSIELNYTKTISKGNISLSTFYRRTHDKIGRILQKDKINSGKVISSFSNYDFADSYGIELSGSYKPLKWWTFRPSFETYIQYSQGLINNSFEQVKNKIIKGRISNFFKASKKLSFQLSATYRGKNENIQYTVEPYTMINAGVRLKIFNRKGNIILRANDIFNNLNFDYFSKNPFIQKGKYTLEYNSISLSFSYNFGNGKNKRKGRKYRDNNESQGGMF